MSTLGALVATHFFVASMGWAHGYAVGTFLQRRLRDELDSWPPVVLIDLTEPARAYDWAVDGGGECPDCAGTGLLSFPDPFLGGAHLDVTCPTCTRVTP